MQKTINLIWKSGKKRIFYNALTDAKTINLIQKSRKKRIQQIR